MPPRAKATRKSQSIHAVLGSDEGEIKRAATTLAAKLTPPDGGDFGTEIVDGAADNVDQAATRIRQTIEALQTFPFFGDAKLVWLKNANFLADSVLGRSEGVLSALEDLAELLKAGLSDKVCFLLSAIDVDKRRSFFKELSKLADVQIFDKLDTARGGWEEAAAELARSRARQIGLDLGGEALDLFAMLSGGESRQIENELEKLDLFLGERRRVTIQDVHALVPLSRAGVIFELGNAIARRDLKHSFALIDQLLFQGESAVGILLVAVIPTVRNLLVCKDLLARHRLKPPALAYHFGGMLNRLPPEATEHLPRKKDGTVNAFALGIAACEAHRHKLSALVEGLEACLQANLQLVTSGLDPKLVLDQLVVKLLAG